MKIITKTLTEKWRHAKIVDSGRKIAVFDADGTLWKDDIGESFFKYQIENKRLPKECTWERYIEEVKHGDKELAYGWLAQWCKGMSESELQRECDVFFDEKFSDNIFKNVKTFAQDLNLLGFELWIVSASPRWPVIAGARKFGIEKERVIAASVKVVNGIVTDELTHPVPFQRHKVELMQKLIGTKPLVAVGNTFWDRFMLMESVDVAIAIFSEEVGGPNFESEQELKKFVQDCAKKGTEKLWVTQKGV